MIVYLFHANYFSFHYLYNDTLQIDDMYWPPSCCWKSNLLLKMCIFE